MKELTASEASRNFSAMLDSVERGETTAVTRAGRRIAIISPAPAANGGALLDVFHRWAANSALDEDFARRVTELRYAASSGADTDPWAD